MDSQQFWTLYAEQDAIRDEAQRLINNAKRDHYATLDAQAGDKGRLIWPDGNNETVAVTGQLINYAAKQIRPAFVLVNRDGTAGKSEYRPQRGYTFELIERGAFPQFMQEDYPDAVQGDDPQLPFDFPGTPINDLNDIQL